MAEGFLQVLGLMRWSYPSDPAAFDQEASTLEAIRAELYAEARLEERMFYLETMILPCLAAQTDKNFKVVMLMGNELPERWRVRVLEAVSLVPQVVPVFEEEGQKHRLVCRAVMMEHRNSRAAAVAEFRMDDDDALSLDFVAEVRRYYRRHRGLVDARGRMALDFTQGFAMDFRGDAVTIHPIYAQLWVAAMALIYPPTHPRSLIDYPHKGVWKAMPTISIPGGPSWLRGVHGTNDSGIGDTHFSPHAWEFDLAEAEEMLLERFGIDWPHLQSAWAEFCARVAA